MKCISLLFAAGSLFTGCMTNTAKTTDTSPKDTLTYAYHALYSSDITDPGDPIIAQKV
jgi:hypothetical protein